MCLRKTDLIQNTQMLSLLRARKGSNTNLGEEILKTKHWKTKWKGGLKTHTVKGK